MSRNFKKIGDSFRKENMKKQLLLIGYGMVGHKFLEEFKDLDGFEKWNVTVISEEAVGAYDRVNLSKLFYEQNYNLFFSSEATFAKAGVRFFYNSKAIELDTQNHFVVLDDGKIIEFECCVLATGSYPFVPPVVGIDPQRCFTYRNIVDATQIIEKAKTSSKALVIGGGLLGIEAGAALQNLDLEVELVEQSKRVMPTQLDAQGSTLLEKKLLQQGIKLTLAHLVSKIETNYDSSLSVELKPLFDAENPIITRTDMVIFSVGVRPNDHLARKAGLVISPRGGIEVDLTSQTSCESIYAIGECASIDNKSYGLVGPGYQMAKVAASNIVGVANKICYLDTSTKLKLSGLEVGSFGNPFADSNVDKIIYYDPKNFIYRTLVISKEQNKLLGGILIGDSSSFSVFRSLILDPQDQEVNFSDLVLPQNDDALVAGSICNCDKITFVQIADLVNHSPYLNSEEILEKLGTSFYCKFCLSEVKDLVSKAYKCIMRQKQFVCFHFDYSTDQLNEIASTNYFADFDTFIQNYGRGRGCNICKKVVEDAMGKQKLAKVVGM